MDDRHLARIAVSVPSAGVHQLLADRFRGTPVGAALSRGEPLGGAELDHVVNAVAGEMDRDENFANALRYHVYNVDNSGDLRNFQAGPGARIRQTKRYWNIGNVRVGTGGLVTGAALLVVLLGGGTAAVVLNAQSPVALAAAVGRWEQPASTPMQGFETTPTVLTITESGEFTFSTGLTMQPPPGFPQDRAQPSGIRLDCRGTVTPDGDQFTLRTTAGPCGTFSAKPTADGTIMDVFLQNGSADGSTALRKSG
ncbi:hypothetical protein [Nocardia sp. NRRL S-836]|uniref:hypothetical protein n=1 Tax=Nocardia sp. NRRL S-836 TaxID=1519492 RepID=UPI0006AE6B14|nr:hypothetical protein [Nocardia sp. NRRL S-836]KOV84466.1 hypothetical protein ADL03_16330 [Nocardia sp. NRRL S-836]